METPYTDVQYRKLAALAESVMAAWPEITQDRITGHSDIAPGQETDPGPAFDWAHFRSLLRGKRAARVSTDGVRGFSRCVCRSP